MAYPLDVGGVDDYPVKVGSMLLTLVDPHPGHERAYNRWYERDHFYAGCMVGPHCLAGSRWVAPRRLKDRRWPRATVDGSSPAVPYDAGSYVAVYFVERGHHDDFFGWGRKQVGWLYGNGRGFAERSHVHTVLFDHLGAAYRDDDPVPVELALDAVYDALVVVWFDGAGGRDASAVSAELDGSPHLGDLLAPSSPIEIASAWTPTPGQTTDAPMHLGSPAGGRERLVQLLFVRGDVETALPRIESYTDAVEAAGLASTRLVAPFLRTVVGTDTHVDELW
jgi:hypothetical protein